MKKLNALVMGLLLPVLAAAQTVKSPNGKIGRASCRERV